MLAQLAYMALMTNCHGLLYIGIINSIELVLSSARVTSAKFQPKIETPGPIDRTPGTPGSGKKVMTMTMTMTNKFREQRAIL